METLLVVAQDRNLGYSRSTAHVTDPFSPSPPRRFNGTNCRTFQSGNGSFPTSPPFFPSYSRSSEFKNPVFKSEPPKRSRSSPIAIIPKQSPEVSSFCEELSCSELWAGPTYSNSPPPSSLPIPKFFLPHKHSISVNLPIARSKSAPPAPIRDSPSPSPSPSPDFFFNTASATENLRRILNLDLIN